jgi:hypothetical protein
LLSGPRPRFSQFEHKVSVVNFQLRRHPEYQEPIKGKEQIVLHVGFRRFPARPIYSGMCALMASMTPMAPSHTETGSSIFSEAPSHTQQTAVFSQISLILFTDHARNTKRMFHHVLEERHVK